MLFFFVLKEKGTTDLKNCWVISIILPAVKVYFANNHTIAWSVSIWSQMCPVQHDLLHIKQF